MWLFLCSWRSITWRNATWTLTIILFSPELPSLCYELVACVDYTDNVSTTEGKRVEGESTAEGEAKFKVTKLQSNQSLTWHFVTSRRRVILDWNCLIDLQVVCLVVVASRLVGFMSYFYLSLSLILVVLRVRETTERKHEPQLWILPSFPFFSFGGSAYVRQGGEIFIFQENRNNNATVWQRTLYMCVCVLCCATWLFLLLISMGFVSKCVNELDEFSSEGRKVGNKWNVWVVERRDGKLRQSFMPRWRREKETRGRKSLSFWLNA